MTDLVTPTAIAEILDAAIETLEASVRSGYSGRGMYGETCWGIVCDRYDVEAIRNMGIDVGIGRGEIDNMGRDAIVYWPDLKS